MGILREMGGLGWLNNWEDNRDGVPKEVPAGPETPEQKKNREAYEAIAKTQQEQLAKERSEAADKKPKEDQMDLFGNPPPAPPTGLPPIYKND